jgi:hypothetical protein
MLQIIKSLKEICWSNQHHGDMHNSIGAFTDMDHLPYSDDMVAHPALLTPHMILVDKDVMLPYFPNLVEAVPGHFNATPFFMAHSIPFDEIQVCVVLHVICPHSIKISPDQSDPYDIPNDMVF